MAVTNLAADAQFPAALVVAHPGHELRVHGWLEQARPIVFVLTDGSGHGGTGRLESTRRLIERAGARTGSVFGRFSDRQLYGALLSRDAAFFTSLADELASALIEARITCVVADAAEGYNTGHDICRYIVDAAVQAACDALPPGFRSCELDLLAAPDSTSADAASAAICLTLGDEALERKLAAARGYPEMAHEVESALARWGAEAFRREWLREARPERAGPPAANPPFYERHGERRAAEGIYEHVIRYDEHMRPIREALARHAAAARRWLV